MKGPRAALTDQIVEQARPDSKAYKLSDSGSMFLLVYPNVGKYWRIIFCFSGKQETLLLRVFLHSTRSIIPKVTPCP